MKLLFYKSLLLFFAFTGIVLGQKHVVYHKVFYADKNTVLNIDLDKINIAIEESTDGKIHFDYNTEYENFTTREINKIKKSINVETKKTTEEIKLTASTEDSNSSVRYIFNNYDDATLVLKDAKLFKKDRNKIEKHKKTKDSILSEIRRTQRNSSFEELSKSFKLKNIKGVERDIKRTDVKIEKNNFIIKIPQNIKMIINAKDSNIHLKLDYNHAINITLKYGSIEAKELNNLNNVINIENAKFLVEKLSAKNVSIKNVSKCLIGEIQNIFFESETSKIEIGEILENVSLSDYDSDYFLYGYSNNFKRSDFMGIYSEIHFFEPETDYNLEVFGHDTTFYFDNNTVVSQPSKDGKIKKMMDRKLKGDKPFSGNLKFNIIHSNFYYPTEFTPNKNK